jgi:IS30 family transposase
LSSQYEPKIDERLARVRVAGVSTSRRRPEFLRGGVVPFKGLEGWSPQQIAGWLKDQYPENPEMWVSHETIYCSLFVQARGALKKELVGHLRSRRRIRRPRHAIDGRNGDRIIDAV